MQDNRLYDEIKDTMLLCTTNAEALQLADEYPAMTRFLPEQYRYYLYTVDCRRGNTFPKCIELWRQS